MENDDVRQIDFGIKPAHSFNFGTATVHGVFKINEREELIATSKEIVRVDSNVIVKKSPHVSNRSVYCPSYDALVTLTEIRSTFSIFFVEHSIKEPVATGIPVDQTGIQHILFDDIHGIIVTLGNGIKTWYLDSLRRKQRTVVTDNKANIIERAFFALDYTSFTLEKPSIDSQNQKILIPTKNGILCYDYDGNVLKPPLKYNNHWFTMFAINPFNNKMITSDKDEAKESKMQRAANFGKPIVAQGVQYWRKDGTLSKMVPFTNNSIYAGFFLNKEFIVVIDAQFIVHIIDLKTQKFFTCLRLECRPFHIYFQNDQRDLRIVICSAMNVFYYNICVPWRLWARTQIAATRIMRCPKLDYAARIAAEFVDSSIRLFTPSASLLTLCHSRNPSTPSCVVVDRGTPDYEDRDQVIVVLENGTVELYAPKECPCGPFSTFDIKAHSCCVVNFLGELSICFGTRIGDIMVYDYNSMQYKKRIKVCQGVITHLFPHTPSNSLLVIIDYMMYRISLEDGSLIETHRQNDSPVEELYDDILIAGYENGSFLIEKILDRGVDILHKSPHPQHQGKVVGISRGKDHFFSAGYDGSVLVWNFNAEVLVKLTFPLHLYSVGVHNGFRGLLVATDSEIMIVDGRTLFGDEVDEEDVPYDNYDKRRDYLLENLIGYRTGGDEEVYHGVSKDIKTKVHIKKHRLDASPRKKHPRKEEQVKGENEGEEKEKEESLEQEGKKNAEEEEKNEQDDEEKAKEQEEIERKRRALEEEEEALEEERKRKQQQQQQKDENQADDNKEKEKNNNKKQLHILSGTETVVMENQFDGKPKFSEEEIQKKRKELEEKEEKERKKKEKTARKKKEKEEEEKRKKKEEKKNKGKDSPDAKHDRKKKEEGEGETSGETKQVKPPQNRPSAEQVRKQRMNKPKGESTNSPTSPRDNKENPRNKIIRRNPNDPNANPKYTSQLIDGVVLDEAGEGKAYQGKGGKKGKKSKKGGRHDGNRGAGKGSHGNGTSGGGYGGDGSGRGDGRDGTAAGGKSIYGDGVNGGGYGPGGGSGVGPNGTLGSGYGPGGYESGTGQGTNGQYGPVGSGSGQGANGEFGYGPGKNGQGGYGSGDGQGANGQYGYGPGQGSNGPYGSGENGQGPNGEFGYGPGQNGQGGYGPGGSGSGQGSNSRGGYGPGHGNNMNRSTSPLYDNDSLLDSTRKHKKVTKPSGNRGNSGRSHKYSTLNGHNGQNGDNTHGEGYHGNGGEGVGVRTGNNSSLSQTLEPHRKILRGGESKRKRPSTPSGDQLYRLHHIIHVHIKVNREFPPDIDIRKTKNPPCLIYSPEYLALALGDSVDETTWQKFKRMCCFQGVNDFNFESFSRTKHFMLENTERIESKKQQRTEIPIIEVCETGEFSCRPTSIAVTDIEKLRAVSARSDYFSVLNRTKNSTNQNSIMPALDLERIKYDYDHSRVSMSARSTRSTISPMQHSKRPISMYPWLDDEMLRPSSSRRIATPVKIINPTGKAKQMYRNLESIFKTIRHR